MKRNLMSEILTSFLLVRVIEINGQFYEKQNLGIGPNSQPYDLIYPEESLPVRYNEIESDGVHKSDSSGSDIIKNVYFYADSPDKNDEPVPQNLNKIQVVNSPPSSYNVILVNIPAEWIRLPIEQEKAKVNVILQEVPENRCIERRAKKVFSGQTLRFNEYSNYDVTNNGEEQYVRIPASNELNIFQRQKHFRSSDIASGINALAESYNRTVAVTNYPTPSMFKAIRYTNVAYRLQKSYI